MSGSGNDFVFFDARGNDLLARQLAEGDFVRRVSAPHTGIGADGVAIIQDSAQQDFRLTYLNRDGSLGELCGNASLCATRLAVELGIANAEGLTFETGAGEMTGRMNDGLPEVDLQAPTGLRADAGISKLFGERNLGYVNTGVPHLVVRADDANLVEVSSRGPELRYHESLRAGANVNWVSPAPNGSWRMRTYERGVEAETLACGTGAVACAVLLSSWGESGAVTRLATRSGQVLTVTLRESSGGIRPSLAGNARIVFEGSLREI